MPRKFRTQEGKEHARRRFTRWLFVWGSGVVFFFALLVLLLWQQFLRIDVIITEDGRFFTENELRDVAARALEGVRWYGVPRDSGIFFSGDMLRRAVLDAFPSIETVSTRRLGFDTLYVVAQERHAVARWCGDVVPPDISFDAGSGVGYGTCFLVDKEGYIFAPASHEDTNGTRYYGALSQSAPIKEHVAPSEEFARLELLIGALAAADMSVSALLIVDERDIEFALADGTWVRVLREDDSESIVTRIVSTLSSDVIDTTKTLSYIDMRFGNKVYVKYREDQSTTQSDASLEEEGGEVGDEE